MDEALILCGGGSVRAGGLLRCPGHPGQKIGRFDTELVYEFMTPSPSTPASPSTWRRCAGRNSHHIVEGPSGLGRPCGRRRPLIQRPGRNSIHKGDALTMQERLNRLYEQYGYRKFKMSRFEDYDLYAQNRDFLRQDRIITFTDADGALKALKPDITLSIMKSNGGDSEKVYYNENVCREVGGAFREILQVGVESVAD